MIRPSNSWLDADALRRVHTAPFEPAPPEAWFRKDGVGPVRCPCLVGLGHYALWMAAQFLFSLQWSVEPSVGGLSGLISSASRTMPLWGWTALYWALGWLGTAYAMAILFKALPVKALPASIRKAPSARIAGAAVALGASAALFAWLYSSHYLLPWTTSFFMAPMAMVVIIDRLSVAYKKAAFAALAATAIMLFTGWCAPSLAPIFFTEDERAYANLVTKPGGYYDCDFGFHSSGEFIAKYSHDYADRVVDVERQGEGVYKARVHVSRPFGVPYYGADVYFARETTTIVRPDYVEACLNAKDIRAEEIGENGEESSAPWRWRRSADGGASWADVPHSPHKESAETEGYTYRYAPAETAGYTYRYVPTKADLADADILLRACVDVRGGGEVCTPGVSPSP